MSRILRMGPLKLTPRQVEVMTNLSSITTDGSRHEPQFWLSEKNVSSQVRSLRNQGLLDLEDGRLIKVERPIETRRPVADAKMAVAAMRELLGSKT